MTTDGAAPTAEIGAADTVELRIRRGVLGDIEKRLRDVEMIVHRLDHFVRVALGLAMPVTVALLTAVLLKR